MLVLRKLRNRSSQSDRFFAADGVLAGRRLPGRMDCGIANSLLSIDCPLAGVKQVARGIANVPLVNLTQPGGKLGVVVSLELGDLLVDREARLLNHVRRIDSRRRPIIEHSVRQAPEITAILLQQLAQCRLVAAPRPLDQLAIDGVGFDVASAAADCRATRIETKTGEVALLILG